MKLYHFKVYVDVLIDESHIDMEKRHKGIFECNADTLREALYILCNCIFDTYDTNMLKIGLSHIGNYCDDKPITDSYIRKVISQDSALRLFMWH